MDAKLPTERIAFDFFNALERLKNNKPVNRILLARSKRARLKINFSTVSQEAGHSRTLISQKSSPYPEVRAAVLAEITKQYPLGDELDQKRRVDAQTIIANLRERLMIEQNEKRVLATRLVEAENIARHYKQQLMRSIELSGRTKIRAK